MIDSAGANDHFVFVHNFRKKIVGKPVGDGTKTEVVCAKRPLSRTRQLSPILFCRNTLTGSTKELGSTGKPWRSLALDRS